MKLTVHRGRHREYEDENGRRYFSVSEVRKVAFDPYAGVDQASLDRGARRGTALHKRMVFVFGALEGLCEYPAVHTGFEGYCQSMDRWIEKRKPVRVKLEMASCNERYGYAGTPDALLNIYLNKKWKKVLFDLKTGSPVRTDPMQLVSYSYMAGYQAEELLDVYLDADGGEAKEQFVTKGSRATEWACFLNALALLKWRNGK